VVKLLAAIAALMGAFQRYRPEAHYMRGPGPACASKRGGGAGAQARHTDTSGRGVDVSDAPAK
jgi:hypothetical protein